MAKFFEKKCKNFQQRIKNNKILSNNRNFQKSNEINFYFQFKI